MTKPAKRKRKRLTQAERQIAEANRLAKLIASAPIEHGSLAAPGLISDPRLAPALAFWREVVPLLEARHVLDSADRFQLAMLSYWWCEFVTASDDVMQRGYAVMVKTVSGDKMPRISKSVSRRGEAFDNIAVLSAKFGLTPLDRHALHRAAKAGFLSAQLPLDERAAVNEDNNVAQWDLVGDARPN